jgi:7-keto-8-aminopelargonate synthetase-like enzyme
MCSCSYLGLDVNRKILEGAIEGIKTAGTLHLTTSRVRIRISLLDKVEDALSHHLKCTAICYSSCAAASSAFLPLLASGQFSGKVKPIMLFDKHAHFSMNIMKALCADETEVYTINHNDLNAIEDKCKTNCPVAYIGEGIYSIEGQAPLEELKYLQEKYGLYLYLDDSHGLSIIGKNGEGYVRKAYSILNERTYIAASLAKAFGACGGVLMVENHKMKQSLVRHGNSWSQYLNSAGLGAILASLKLHSSSELAILQRKWSRILVIFDNHFESSNKGTNSPIRVVSFNTPDDAIRKCKALLEHGYFTSPVFFPIIRRGTSGMRIMPRANISEQDIESFYEIAKKS